MFVRRTERSGSRTGKRPGGGGFGRICTSVARSPLAWVIVLLQGLYIIHLRSRIIHDLTLKGTSQAQANQVDLERLNGEGFSGFEHASRGQAGQLDLGILPRKLSGSLGTSNSAKTPIVVGRGNDASQGASSSVNQQVIIVREEGRPGGADSSEATIADVAQLPRVNHIDPAVVGGAGSAAAWSGRDVLQTAERGQCAALLQEKDKLSYSRDYREKPVRVFNAEEKTWDDCDVGCVHSMRKTTGVDASLGGLLGGGALTVLRSMEPAAYYPINNPDRAHQDYDIVMTVHFNSDVPVQYGSWEEYQIMKPVKKKTAGVLAAAFISNCNANNFRLQAVEGLMQRVTVDSYGHCLHNKDGGASKIATLERYKFSLAFENSCENDYVTEKYWQSLEAGAVPVVVGAPNIEDFAPTPNSILHMRTLDDLPEVARQMTEISQNETAWNKMMAWKQTEPSLPFLANLDISAVHSSCRLCIIVADRQRVKDALEQRQQRPCRCQEIGADSHTLYHIEVRERHRFYYRSIFLRSDELTLAHLNFAVKHAFEVAGHKPVWVNKRPKVLVNDNNALRLRIFRLYPSGVTQREALHGSAWFRTDEDLIRFLGSNPCPQLDVIFV